MKKLLLSAVPAVVAAVVAAGAVGAQEEGRTGDTGTDSPTVETSEDGIEYVPGELVVVTAGGPREDAVEVVSVEETTLKGLEEKARKVRDARSDAEVVEPNYFFRSSATPNDFRYPDQYFFPQIGAPGAWNNTKGAGVTICVADSGYDHGNPEFADKVVAEKDVVGEVHDDFAEDDAGHGTHVAGVAAAETDNVTRTAGVGWLSKLAIAKFAFYASGVTGGSNADLAQALDWCQSVGNVSVVNASTSGPRSAAVESEVADANAMGMTVVASVGNGGTTETQYPAGYPGVIGVGATDPDETLAAYSNRGPSVDLVAPGTDIISAIPHNATGGATGTSFAAPMVAGGAALLRAKGLNQQQTRDRLFKHAEDRGPTGRDAKWGHGFLNLRCATQPSLNGCN